MKGAPGVKTTAAEGVGSRTVRESGGVSWAKARMKKSYPHPRGAGVAADATCATARLTFGRGVDAADEG